ncbi:MAG TPA: YihY/virulence factor BrkB family protein [Rhodoglobus sp.]|nr:YihY/virulence factor BrkB family protein [Rhodoglobus sp.]HQJ35013.1 YihY/virulence factor BrkB family protein [Rhodoglobus sp.]
MGARTRIASVTRWARRLFPVRVWLHFLDRNGFLLAAGMSYQALFAVFAAAYVGLSIAGFVVVGNEAVLDAAITLINTWVPGLLGADGIIDPEAFRATTTVLSWTGLVALGSLIWTAIGWVTYSRMAVRTVFGLEKDKRNYVVMKARDLLVAAAFGVALLVAAALSVASTELLDWIFSLLGWSTSSEVFRISVRVSGLVLVFAIDTLALAAMFRFLSRAAIQWRRLWGGSLLGGAGLVALQLLGSLLAGGITRNPLLATFAVFVGLLLFFRLTSIVTLVAAAWIAVGAHDRDESLRLVSPEQLDRERADAEHRALLLAAQVRVREARAGLDAANWFERPSARRHLRGAEEELEQLRDRT